MNPIDDPSAAEWQPISTAPQDGTELELHHVLCPGYDTTGACVDGEWALASFFINGRTMMLHAKPTHWRPVSA